MAASAALFELTHAACLLGMATETAATPGAEPVPLKLKRRRRSSTSPNLAKTRWTKETRPKSPGRPKGAITTPYATVTGLMQRVFRDPIFQNNFLWRAQMGLLKPPEIQLAAYYAEGRPGYKVQVTFPVDPTEIAERERLRKMDPAVLARENDLLRQLAQVREQRALPQATVLSSETAQIAEVVTAPESAPA